MVSPSAAAFFFSLAFALAVVDKTAVATFVTASFLGGCIGAGYAKRLGFALDRNSNFGACSIHELPHKINAVNTYTKCRIKSDDSSRLKCQRSTVGQRVPVPKLAEQNHADDGTRLATTSTATHVLSWAASSPPFTTSSARRDAR